MSVVNTIGKLIVLAIGIELVQMLIVSHTCDALDVLLYVYGGLMGAGLCVAACPTAADDPRLAGRRVAARVLLAAALVVEAVLVVGSIFPAGGPLENRKASLRSWLCSRSWHRSILPSRPLLWPIP